MTGWLGLDEEDKCAIFIDGANLYKTARTLGFDIDYKALLKKTQQESRLIRASYYTAMQEDRAGGDSEAGSRAFSVRADLHTR